MITYQQYRDYLRDNPKGYWFKAKLYGWGWTPATWQGWLAILVWLIVIFYIASRVEDSASLTDLVWSFFAPLLLSTIALITLCRIKGEKPSWRWGLKSKK